MQFKVDGVDAETGKKVKPLDISAPDLREAATLAKIRGVLPTRITPVTELLTIVKEPEPGTDRSQTKRTTLISIEGRPLWFAATLGVGLLIAVMWYLIGGESEPLHLTAPAKVPAIKNATGLGWTLRDVEATWTAENGWYWAAKQRAQIGTGIEYVGSNTDYPWVTLAIAGDPENLHTFKVVAVLATFQQFEFDYDEADTRFLLACGMVNNVMGSDASAFEEWTIERVNQWVKDPQIRYEVSRFFGEKSAQLLIEVEPENLILVLTITR